MEIHSKFDIDMKKTYNPYLPSVGHKVPLLMVGSGMFVYVIHIFSNGMKIVITSFYVKFADVLMVDSYIFYIIYFLLRKIKNLNGIWNMITVIKRK